MIWYQLVDVFAAEIFESQMKKYVKAFPYLHPPEVIKNRDFDRHHYWKRCHRHLQGLQMLQIVQVVFVCYWVLVGALAD